MSLIIEGVNSFVSLADAKAYFDTKLFCDEWTAAEDPTKEKALIEATNRINRLQFAGVKVDNSQVLQFPRRYPRTFLNSVYMYPELYDLLTTQPYAQPYNNNIFNGFWFKEDGIPDRVKMATYEEAIALLRYGNTTRYHLQAQGVTSTSVGKISENYSGLKRLFSPEALEYLKPYTVITGAII